MTGIKDFKSYLNDRTEDRLSTQEIDAIADHGIIIDGEKMTVKKAAEEYLDQVPGIFIYKREDGEYGKESFLHQACLFMISELVDTDEGVMPQIIGKEIGCWVVGKGDRSSFGLAARSEVQHHFTRMATFDDTINNAIVVKSTCFDSDRKDQIEITIYLA